MHNIAWTQEQVEQLKSLFNEGYTYALIGAKMGYSRSACIGKANRLGLGRIDGAKPKINPRKKVQKRVKKERKPREARVKPVSKPAVRIVGSAWGGLRIVHTVVGELAPLRCVEVEPRHLTLMDLEPGDCRYPYGDEPRSLTFCGNACVEGFSYCRQHKELCLLPAKPPKEPGFVKGRAAA